MQQTITTAQGKPRSNVVNSLAVVGFIALVFIGMVLAIYAARYVPTAVSRIASGAAFLSKNGQGSDTLQVVPSLPFPAATTTAATTTTPAPVATTTAPKPKPAPTPAPKPVQTVPVKVPVAPTHYGLPNLVTTVTAVGYVNDNDVFTADNSINSKQQLAVQFRVKNTGTNDSGAWRIHAVLPTRSDRTFDYTSDDQESLQAGAWVDYTINIETGDVRVDDNQEITITADSDNDVKESNENDNEATATISVSK